MSPTIQDSLCSSLSCPQTCRPGTRKEDLENVINLLLEAELASFLHLTKRQAISRKSPNARNGYYTRTFKSRYGQLTIRIPRDRVGDFRQQTLPFYLRQCSPSDCIFCDLLDENLSPQATRALLGRLYSDVYSKDFIDDMTHTYFSLQNKQALATTP